LKISQDEIVKVRITLINSRKFDLQVDSITIEATGVEVLNYPNNLYVS